MNIIDAVGITKNYDSLTPHSAYQFWLPCLQSSGSTIVDKSGNGADTGTINANNTTEWDNPGYFSTADAANDQGAIVPVSKFSWDMATGQSLWFMWKNVSSNPGDSVAIFGNSAFGGDPGWRVQVLADGDVRLQITDGTNSKTIPTDPGDVIANAELISMAVDGVTKQVYIHSWTAAGGLTAEISGEDISEVTGSTNNTTSGVGIGQNGEAETESHVLQCGDIHCLVWAGGLPVNLGAMISRQGIRPYHPIVPGDFSV